MTPHDELMALAGKWEDLAGELWAEGGDIDARRDCAADLRALLDSDSFRAMVRDARRYQVLRQWFISGDPRYEVAPTGRLKMPTTADIDAWADAAIDAAASGAGESP